MSKKLKWEKIYKKQSNLYGGYYALSPVSDHVYIANKGVTGWNTYIIFKKHLPLLQKITNYILAEEIRNESQSVIDCWTHTLKSAKYEFQTYVDNHFSKKHKISFYVLKAYLEEIKHIKELSDNATSSSSSDKSNNKANSETR
tara:strand:+ start:2372 stop:2800 length:429 start_codon:yes stop_codon:yes gene_type:complete